MGIITYTKQQIDALVASGGVDLSGYMPKTGGIFTGDIAAPSITLNGVQRTTWPGGGGSPGGSGTQLQYRDGAAFGGASTTSVDGSGVVTFQAPDLAGSPAIIIKQNTSGIASTGTEITENYDLSGIHELMIKRGRMHVKAYGFGAGGFANIDVDAQAGGYPASISLKENDAMKWMIRKDGSPYDLNFYNAAGGLPLVLTQSGSLINKPPTSAPTLANGQTSVWFDETANTFKIDWRESSGTLRRATIAHD